MTLPAKIQEDVKIAMRAQDKPKVAALRLITSAIKQIEVDERISVDDERLLQVLDKLAKQRKESIAMFKSANRDDLVEKEQYELELITSYLPAPLTEEELTHLIEKAMQAVNASAMSDMGKVMAYLKPSVQGRCDMGIVSTRIKTRLQAS